MKKSELRAIIKEVLQEELTKLREGSNTSETLKESPVDQQTVRHATAITRAGSVEDLASNIFESDEFQNAFAADGSVFSYGSEAVVADAVAVKFPKLTDVEREKVIDQVMVQLKQLAKDIDKDSELYDRGVDKELEKIYNDNFDIFGNAY
jgi:hypothetical protein